MRLSKLWCHVWSALWLSPTPLLCLHLLKCETFLYLLWLASFRGLELTLKTKSILIWYTISTIFVILISIIFRVLASEGRAKKYFLLLILREASMQGKLNQSFFFKNGPFPASFHLFSSFQTNSTIFTTSKCIQYTVLRFEPTTLGTWVSFHYH